MKMLFLDDMPHRHEAFDGLYDDGVNVITHVETVEEAINALESSEYDSIFLDHDLGGAYYVPSDEKSGYAVAEWIGKNLKTKPLIVIHSMNHVGGHRMGAILTDYGFSPVYSPFTCLMGNY